MFMLLYIIGIFSTLHQAGYCQVLELDDSFLEKKQDRAWLVEFYAPWCGHCRKLEPVFHNVYLDLRASTSVIVAKVDATRFTGVAQHYDVRGYPTIKFIEGENVFTHTGDRSKEAIVQFAKRVKSPHIKFIRNVGKFKEFKAEHSGGAYFMYVGENNLENEFQKEYEVLASKYASYSYFYQGEKRVLPDNVVPKQDPTVLCFKDETFYEYQSDAPEEVTVNLTQWFNMERYPAFMKISGAGINEMSDINKKLIVVVTDEEDKENSRHNRFKDLGRLMATKKRDQYHRDYQFVWMGEPDTMEQITMTSPQTPYIVILDLSSHYYYLPDMDMKDFTMNSFADFIQKVSEGKATPLGGTGILQRFKRLGYDLKSLVVSIYRESPWLALVVFGVPTAVISIVCYALCCMEPFDEDEFYDEVTKAKKRQMLIERAEKGDQEAQALLEELEEEDAEEDTKGDDADGHLKKD